MREISCKKLSAELFSRFGGFADMIHPESNSPASISLCNPPIEFFRDMLQSGLGLDSVASFGVCRVGPRPNVIDASEYHDGACEAMMPIDGDVIIAVAPAVAGSAFPGYAAEAYYVPKGTMFVLRPGVWHHGPFTVGTETVSCLAALPERLYARDCVEVKLTEGEKIMIVGAGLKA
jgi:ureidoglycolate lyase